MAITGARYRWKTFPGGKKVRLAFVGKGKVVEAKSSSGKMHTKEEFHQDALRRARRGRLKRKK